MSLVLILLTAVSGQGEDSPEAWKLIACMQVTRAQLMGHREELTNIARESSFPKKDVLTKCMATMVMDCIARIPVEVCQDIIEMSDDQAFLQQFSQYAPLPSQPFLTPESVALTSEEEILVKSIQQRYEEAKSAPSGESSEEHDKLPQAPMNTSLWLLYVLVVFFLFAAFILYGVKRVQESSKKTKKQKKQ